MKRILTFVIAAPLFIAQVFTAQAFTSAGAAANPTLDIKVDQAGYLPNGAKIALVSSKKPATEFTVNLAKDGKPAFHGSLPAPVEDYDSGDPVQVADFGGKPIKPGTYYIEVPGVGRSFDFDIAPDVYAKPFRLAMRSYYGQRCGTAVDLGPEFPGLKHDACHLDAAFHPSTGKTAGKAPTGGWHDAGDYGRYVPSSGVTTGILLWTYEMYSSRLKSVNLGIPESGKGLPDMLAEIKWNLDWMLGMQDEDGGVWHKQTSDRFSDDVMPDKDKLISYVIGLGSAPYKTSCATGDFAAAMAAAGRVYQPFNPAFGNKCIRAAQKAFEWLEKNPNVPFANPLAVSTNTYADNKCADEQLWAAAELSRTTGDQKYSKYFLDHYGAFRKAAVSDEAAPPAWDNVAQLAMWTYAMNANGDASAINSIRHDLIALADEIANRSTNNGYRISLTNRDYVWGSNGVLANYGMELLIAATLLRNERYAEVALDDLHYLLGRNTFSMSFVTRVGQNSPRHPYHLPSIADKLDEPWPGLLVGGPNRGREDAVMKKMSGDLPPAKLYLDDAGAYSANEVAIDWNAPLVFLLAGAQDLVDGPPARGGQTGRGTTKR